MAIFCFTGVMGSGKTYEAVKTKVVPAVLEGRRVVTNISGINQEKIREYCLAKNPDKHLDDLGEVVVVEDDQVSREGFFPAVHGEKLTFKIPDWVPEIQLREYMFRFQEAKGRRFTKANFDLLLPELEKLRGTGIDVGSCLVEAGLREWKGFEAEWFLDKPKNKVFCSLPELEDSLVQPGDLVVIDEAWRFWRNGVDLSLEHMNFFRMHRHFVHEVSGRSCDLVCLIQDLPSLHRFLRGVLEGSIAFIKLKSLGFSSKYRMEVFEGTSQRASTRVSFAISSYDKDIFPLYKSYDGAKGKEAAVDDRQNIFKSGVLRFAAVSVVALLSFSGWGLYKYFQSLGGSEIKDLKGQSALTDKGSKTASGASVPVQNSLPARSSDWRMAGLYEGSNGRLLVLLQAEDGRTVFREMQGGQLDGWSSFSNVDGKQVSFNFGSKHATNSR